MSKKLDIRKCAVILTTIAFFIYQMYLALVKQLNPLLQSPLHLVFALLVVYLYNPIGTRPVKNCMTGVWKDARCM